MFIRKTCACCGGMIHEGMRCQTCRLPASASVKTPEHLFSPPTRGGQNRFITPHMAALGHEG